MHSIPEERHSPYSPVHEKESSQKDSQLSSEDYDGHCRGEDEGELFVLKPEGDGMQGQGQGKCVGKSAAGVIEQVELGEGERCVPSQGRFAKFHPHSWPEAVQASHYQSGQNPSHCVSQIPKIIKYFHPLEMLIPLLWGGHSWFYYIGRWLKLKFCILHTYLMAYQLRCCRLKCRFAGQNVQI